MTTSLAKKPAAFMREQTQAFRDHSAAMERLRDRFLAGLARLQAEYFDGVKRTTDAMTQATAPDQAPTTEQNAETASPTQ